MFARTLLVALMLAFAANAEGPAPVEVMIGIDCDGDFPYDAVQTWAKTHGRAQDLEAMGAAVEKRMQEESIDRWRPSAQATTSPAWSSSPPGTSATPSSCGSA